MCRQFGTQSLQGTTACAASLLLKLLARTCSSGDFPATRSDGERLEALIGWPVPASTTSWHSSISLLSAAAVPCRTTCQQAVYINTEKTSTGHRHCSCPSVISTCPVIPSGTVRSTDALSGKWASWNSGSSYHGNKEGLLVPTPPKYWFASQCFTSHLLTTAITAAKLDRCWGTTNKLGLERTTRNPCVSAGEVTDEQDKPENCLRISAHILHADMQVQKHASPSKALSRFVQWHPTLQPWAGCSLSLFFEGPEHIKVNWIAAYCLGWCFAFDPKYMSSCLLAAGNQHYSVCGSMWRNAHSWVLASS